MSTPPSSSHFTLQHEIFILDAYLKEMLDFENRDSITRQLVDELLKALRMEELGPLQIFDASDERAPGWSFLQPITTSHISGHYFEKPGKEPSIRMDFYSCAAVNWRKIIAIVHKHLGMGAWQATFIERNIDEMKRNTTQIAGFGDAILDEIDLLDHSKHLISEQVVRAKQPVAA